MVVASTKAFVDAYVRGAVIDEFDLPPFVRLEVVSGRLVGIETMLVLRRELRRARVASSAVERM